MAYDFDLGNFLGNLDANQAAQVQSAAPYASSIPMAKQLQLRSNHGEALRKAAWYEALYAEQERRRAEAAEAAAAESDDGGGIWGAISNPVAKVLSALDVPASIVRGTVAHTVESVGDAIEDPSLGNIADAAYSVTPGVGTATAMIDEEARNDILNHRGAGDYLEAVPGWERLPLPVRQAGGFVGDVALDPLSYLAPQTKLAGGRTAVANRIRSDGVEGAAERALAEGAERSIDDVIARSLGGSQRAPGSFTAGVAAREAALESGQQFADEAATRVLAGGVRRGLGADDVDTFFPGRTGGLKLNAPGTGRVGRAINPFFHGDEAVQLPLLPKSVSDKALAPMDMIGDLLPAARPAGFLGRHMSGSEDTRGLRSAMRSGDVERAIPALVAKNARGGTRAASHVAAQGRIDEYGKLRRAFKGKESDWVAGLEGDVAAAARVGEEPISQGRALLDGIRQDMLDAGVPLNEVEDFFPRILTDEARAAMGGPGSGMGGYDPTTGRKLVAGAQLGDEVLEGTNARIREQVERYMKDELGLHVKKSFFEKHPDQVLPRYIEAAYKKIGRSRWAQSMEEAGIAVPMPRAAQLDDAAIAATDPVAASRLADDPEALADAHRQAVDEAIQAADSGNPHAELLAERAELLTKASEEADPLLRQTAIIEAEAKRAEIAVSEAVTNPAQHEAAYQALRSPKNEQQILDALQRGAYESLDLRNGEMVAPREVAEALNFVSKVNTSEGLRKFLHHYDQLVNGIKAWQVTTPGFHVRNFMGGAFNNYLADMDLGAYRRFFKDRRAFKNGKLTGDKAKAMEQVLSGTEAGQYSAFEISAGGRGGNIAGKAVRNTIGSGNPLVRASTKAGKEVEEVLRGTLAYDRLLNGKTFDQAMDDVAKFHFDYDDLSTFERQVVKRVIPFYTFTRKNFPLQMEMIGAKPYKYARYWQAKTEIERGVGEESVVPSYITDDLMGIDTGWSIGDDRVYGTPDLPFTRALTDLVPWDEDGPDPFKLMGMVTPVIKTPIEAMMGKQFFKDLPLDNDKAPVPSTWAMIPGLMPALDALGWAEKQDGEYVMKGRHAYYIEQFMPLLGRTRRLAPSEDKYQERQITSILSILGVPLRLNTDAEQQSELFRRDMESGRVRSQQVWTNRGDRVFIGEPGSDWYDENDNDNVTNVGDDRRIFSVPK